MALQRVHFLKVHTAPPFSSDVSSKADVVMASLGSLECRFHLLNEADPDLTKEESFETVSTILSETMLCMQEVSSVAENYWLVYNGTVLIMKISQILICTGLSALAVESLIFCSLSMESHLPLMDCRYLTWRTRIYETVCTCYELNGMLDDAISFAKRGLAQIKKLASVHVRLIFFAFQKK